MNIEVFQESMRTDKEGREFWTSREMSKVLGYKDYRNFIKVVERAKEACSNSGQQVENNFIGFNDMIEIGNGALRKVRNIKLSRYACYLIMQNADPSKEIVAQGQSYFALQTRKQEIQQQQLEDQKRVVLREEMKKHNKELAKTARKAGVKNYAQFIDHGYMGLYGGMRSKELHEKKGLGGEKKILDHMNSEELGANLFRATQTEAMIKRETIKGQFQANQAHYSVGKKVRQTISELGGTMPEQLPAVEHIKEAKKRLKTMAYNATPDNSEETSAISVSLPTFPLPDDAGLLARIISTIKEHEDKEGLKVKLGEHVYAVDKPGLEQLLKIME